MTIDTVTKSLFQPLNRYFFSLHAEYSQFKFKLFLLLDRLPCLGQIAQVFPIYMRQLAGYLKGISVHFLIYNIRQDIVLYNKWALKYRE